LVNVCDHLREDERAEFLEEFNLVTDSRAELIMMMRIEMSRPNRSDLSDRIRGIVGSDEASNIASYLNGHNPELAASFSRELESLRRQEKFTKYEDESPWFTTFALFLVSLIPIYLFLRRPDVSIIQTFYVLLICDGCSIALSFLLGAVDWWMDSHLAVSRLRQFVTLGILSLLLMVYLEIMFYKVLKFTHKAGLWRVLLFQFTWFFTAALITFTMIRPTTEWLARIT
jgi:hypothetical protein